MLLNTLSFENEKRQFKIIVNYDFNKSLENDLCILAGGAIDNFYKMSELIDNKKAFYVLSEHDLNFIDDNYSNLDQIVKITWLLKQHISVLFCFWNYSMFTLSWGEIRLDMKKWETSSKDIKLVRPNNLENAISYDGRFGLHVCTNPEGDNKFRQNSLVINQDKSIFLNLSSSGLQIESLA